MALAVDVIGRRGPSNMVNLALGKNLIGGDRIVYQVGTQYRHDFQKGMIF